MSLFISDEELSRLSGDALYVAEKAEVYIRGVHGELETVRAQADAAAITAEQTCSLLEQKYLSLSAEFTQLESQNTQLRSSLDDNLSELANVKSQKHQLHLQSIGKDGEIERLTREVSELHKSKRQLIELVEQKDLEISEKNATIKSYLDKIVNLTDSAAQKEARLSEFEAQLARSQATCARLSQEKELVERHNVWLNDELTAKVDSLIELRRAHSELEADMSAKLTDAERRFNECSGSLNWNKERVRELEMKLLSLQEELCSTKDAATANEERSTAELTTANKLVDLYKESSEEWSQKAGELEGVIKALETHLNQVENDYKEKLEKESSSRKQFEKDAADLKVKLERCEAEIESSRKANELNLLPLHSFNAHKCMDSYDANEIIEVPKIPFGVSGTALAASLLRDGWSLAKMYAKYQEAIDALRHEQLGRKESEAILQRVLYELEEKAGVILDEREEHDRMVEAYSTINQKLQHSISEQANLEKTIQELKADLRKRERDYNISQKEIVDLQKQVTVLLKECRDIQLRLGYTAHDQVEDYAIISSANVNAESDTEKIISDRLLTFKDINGLVEQNVQLRSLVRNLSDQIQNRESELKEEFEMVLKKHADDATSKVAAVLERAEEQGRMIESLHTSVAMYKRLYEEEHKLHSSYSRSIDGPPEDRRNDMLLVLEGSQEAMKSAQEKASEHVRSLEEDLTRSRSEAISLRSERDKLALEATFARERLDSFMKEFEHQRNEMNAVLSRNVEFSQLIVDYQRKVRENSESSHASEELSRKLTMELSLSKQEKEMLSNAEKRACAEVHSLLERVHRLQASLDTIQSTEEVREEARASERRKQEEHIKQVEREWAEVKKELQQERDNVRALTLDREQTLKNAMRQVEEIGKELADALRAVSAAESRASVAEAKLSELEPRIKSSDVKFAETDDDGGRSSVVFTSEDFEGLRIAKEEMAKLKEEAEANKNHMLQYKSIAQVNETALKQMEVAHADFKIEAEKLKESLESELLSLRIRTTELENELSLKSGEVSSAVAGKEEALSSALAEIRSLKEESSVKISHKIAMEVQISALKEDLEKEHERRRAAQTNYERQVVLQSETIQELTKTSQSLATLQQEASDLRKLVDAYKSENIELKANWEAEKLMFEKSKNEAKEKYDELTEQNKILHRQLHLRISLVEKDRNSTGFSSESTSQGSLEDDGLQNVISFIRRGKEIAETEVSLLKQERLRLQTQLESALKAVENAQASLNAERANSRALLLTKEEIKSLQLQVREMNLLRESNMQLREENKYNFEECQKLREVAQKAKVDYENVESLLREKQIEVDACKKEIDMLKMEKDHLEKRVCELLETCKNVDVVEYEQMKDDVRRMQEKLEEKDAEMEELKSLISKYHDTVTNSEQALEKSKLELNEREKRINEILLAEASLRSEVEKQRKLIGQLKRRFDTSTKEKEELSKQNLVLSKQMEDSKQGKRSTGNVSGEQVMKEKEEKDTRIQILERTLERQREELRKEKEDHQTEKVKRQNCEKSIVESIKKSDQGKEKFTSEFEKHKQALKRLSDELEKIKQAESKMPEGTSVVQFLSGPILDDFGASYVSAINNFEKVAQAVSIDLGISLPADASTVGDITSQTVPVQAPSIVSAINPVKIHSPSKAMEEKERRFSLPKTVSEPRKTGRKLVRPRLVKPEEPQADTEMSETDGANNGGKLAPLDTEALGTSLLTQVAARKRQTSSIFEINEELDSQGDTSSDPGAHVLKKARSSDSKQEDAERQAVAPSENLGSLPAVEESLDAVSDLPSSSTVNAVDTENEETNIAGEELKESEQLDGLNQVELQTEEGIVLEEILDKPRETEMVIDEASKYQAEEDVQQSIMESESDREEGELLPDAAENEGATGPPETSENQENMEVQADAVATPSVSPARVDEESQAAVAVDLGEIGSSDFLNDEKNEGAKNDEGDDTEESNEVPDKSNDGDGKITVASDQNVEAGSATAESTSSVVIGSDVSRQGTSSVTVETEEVRQASPAGNPSTVVNILERAKEKAALRQARPVVAPPTVSRGRGRVLQRGRVPRGRGARGGRGQSPGQQN
ncbi:nuclear-pore anchor isoform X1 [Tripterygium wilfordii]|uniref:Nuclear-pore anchor isoform X1 n=2 Tax=Tripterygium wilfordii TaxID=458696 RepID=A0A7J7C1Y2_TRIWF|nr:nuclear-pore anchor isoform X1 [Tripterygium wilfordii]